MKACSFADILWSMKQSPALLVGLIRGTTFEGKVVTTGTPEYAGTVEAEDISLFYHY